MSKFLLMMWMAVGASWASSIYQVQFVGTFGEGAFAFTFGANGQPLEQSLTGLTLRGKISIVMDALPGPTSVTEFVTSYETIGSSPLWLQNAEFSVDGFSGFANGLFESGPYFLESVPVPAGGTAGEPSAYEQRFGVLESLNALQLGLIVKDVWTNPAVLDFQNSGVWNLNAQGLSGTPYNPQTGQFQAISGTPSFSTGFVRYQRIRSVNNVTLPGFTMIENTFIQGSFSASSVTGEVVVPEPGTWWALAGGLGGIVLLRRRG
ncbi:MAG: PEP-CTERM sorting domain-containing protein [Acidobacteria bacterium]|nr:PEP-CTERM sorting domain-containing protein [Acidobacteriota bacterium]